MPKRRKSLLKDGSSMRKNLSSKSKELTYRRRRKLNKRPELKKKRDLERLRRLLRRRLKKKDKPNNTFKT